MRLNFYTERLRTLRDRSSSQNQKQMSQTRSVLQGNKKAGWGKQKAK